MENEQLKQEVARLTKDLTQVKGKTKQAQLHQDNTVKGVKKLDEGQTVVCYVCHKEGHKSYECKVKNGGRAKKKEKKQTSKLSNTYTYKVDKKASTPYLLKKKKMTRWWPSRRTSKPTMGLNTFGCQRKSFST